MISIKSSLLLISKLDVDIVKISANIQLGKILSVMGHLDTNNFYFILFYFSDFTFLFFSFIFLLEDDEEGM